MKSESEVAQLCPTLSDPMDCSLPGSSNHGIFQARVLEWFNTYFVFMRASLIAQMVKESTRNAGDPSLIPGLGRSAGEGIGTHSNILGLPLWLSWLRICLQCGRPGFDPWVGKIPYPLQYSDLENSMACIVHGVAKSWT